MIRLYVDGSTTPVSQAEAADGTFSISLAGLSPGNHTLTATAQAAGENESAPTAAQTFAGPPALVVVVPPPVVIPPPPVTTPPPAQAPGQWMQAATPGISLDPNFGSGGAGSNFGIGNIEVDPVRPSDVYITGDYSGLWKSTAFGADGSFKKINTGRNAANIDLGRPAFLIAVSDLKRDPSTPPTLYTAPLYGPVSGLYKSVNGGVDFDLIKLPAFADGLLNGQDPYSLAFDPYDVNHFLISFHGTSELVETTDGGKTFRVVPTTAAMGASFSIFFIDTGSAVTTRGNWNTISQWGTNINGVWRTPDGAVTPFAQVTKALEHFHGAQQVECLGNGVAITSGTGGIYMTTDSGASWPLLTAGNGNGVVVSPKNIYDSFGWATSGTWAPQMMMASRAALTKWTPEPAPAAMTNGAKHGIAIFDGTNHIVLTANGNGGLWRLVEAV